MTNDLKVWTPITVKRENTYKIIAVLCYWDQNRDQLWFVVDGRETRWHRRGAKLFASRGECVQYNRKEGLFNLG